MSCMSITLICGDALNELKDLPDEEFNAIITDPPYARIDRSRAGLKEIKYPEQKYIEWWGQFIELCERIIKPTGYLIFKFDDFTSKLIFPAMERFEYIGDVIWNKRAISKGFPVRHQHEVISIYRPKIGEKGYYFAPPKGQLKSTWHGDAKGRSLRSVINARPIRNGMLGSEKQEHANQTPPFLWSEIMRFLVPKRGHVLDPFMGSASVGIACQWLNIDYTGIEIDPDFYAIAKRKLQKTNHVLIDFLENAKEGVEI